MGKIKDKNDSYLRSPIDERFILITDLGILAKKNYDKSYDIFIQSINSGDPVLGSQVDVIGVNGISILTKKTNSLGRVSFPNLNNFRYEKKPLAFVARRGSDVSFLPINKNDREIFFSKFDIGGLQSNTFSKGLSAYLFSDRGIYRPGDTIKIGMIIKDKKWDKSLKGIPLEIVVKDSRDNEVFRKKIKIENGIEEFFYKTSYVSSMGTYNFSLYLIEKRKNEDGINKEYRSTRLGYTTVEVEEFVPDRLKISSLLNKNVKEGWVKPNGLRANVTLRNLYGTAAVDHKVRGEFKLIPIAPAFSEYSDYDFHDPFKAQKTFSERLASKKTDEEGRVFFDFDFSFCEKSSFQLFFNVEGFEKESGKSVITSNSLFISPNEYFVGYKSNMDLSYIKKGQNVSVNFIAVSPKVEKINVKGLKYKIFRSKLVSVLTKQESGIYKYESIQKEELIEENNFEIPKKGLNYIIKSDKEGDFKLVILDQRGTELNSIAYSIIGQGDLSNKLSKNAELELKLNKKDFEPGEEIEVFVKSPYVGSGIITIEREKIYAVKWFKTNSKSFMQKINVPKNIEGNAYINVSFLRSINSNEIYMTPFSYAVENFYINKDKRKLNIDLNVSSKAKPGENFHINISSQKKAKAIVFAIDEGILQVARYKNPDPLEYFFRKKALEVRTFQILDLIMPEFRILKKFFSPGGDSAQSALGADLNPFKRKIQKAMAYWSGIIDIDPKSSKSTKLKFKIPDYFNGTLRTIAVVDSGDKINVEIKKTIVQGDFILTPTVPFVVSPEDEFDVSLVVANNLEASEQNDLLELEVELNKLSFIKKPPKKIKVSQGKDVLINFRVKAKNELGNGSILFHVRKNSSYVKYSSGISIRPAIPFYTLLKNGVVKKDDVKISLERNLRLEYSDRNIILSYLPIGISKSLIKFLNKFPHGCTEQLISQIFPMLILYKNPHFSFKYNEIQEKIDETFRKLSFRQDSEGGIHAWSVNSPIELFHNVYAMHFLTEAKERGFEIPGYFFNKGLDYLKTTVEEEPINLADARIHAYSIYILTRNEYITSIGLTKLIEYLEKNFKDKWKEDLISAYIASVYLLLKKEDKAVEYFRSVKVGKSVKPIYNYYYDSIFDGSFILYLMSKHFPEKLKEIKHEEFLKVIDPILKGKHNTINSSLAILGIDAYSKEIDINQLSNVELIGINKNDKQIKLTIPNGLAPLVVIPNEIKELNLKNSSDAYLFYNLNESGFDKKVPDKELKNKIEIYRFFKDVNGDKIEKIKQGDEIYVHINVRSLVNERDYKNVAVLDLLPGGFEVIEKKVVQDTNWNIDHFEEREDRVILYGSIGTHLKTYVYKIKAINKGKYIIPPIVVKSLYDPDVIARSTKGIIEIVK